LFDLEIHNDGGGMSLEDEVTLFTLFPAINSLPEHYIKLAYEKICADCVFTENANANYKSAKQRYSSLKTHPGILKKIIKIWNNDYYEAYLPTCREEA
jgi:predicted nucleic-acid-binding Zn-ribbon protein